MKYIGVPRCPYCKKRVSIIRTWRLKREGEYKCPRCSGISNIYLSPLIYVFALVAVFAGGALYFFHKFVLDDIEPMTALEVFIPFVVFFFVSLFLVYLEKPMMKKVKKGAKNQKSSGIPAQPVRKVAKRVDAPNRSFADDDYVPRSSTQTGPVYQESGGAASEATVQHSSASFRTQNGYTEEMPSASAQYSGRTDMPAVNRPGPVPQESYQRPAAPVQSPVRAVTPVDVTAVGANPQNTGAPSHTVSSINISEDYFSKYDDPEYIQKRMDELKNKENGS